MSGSLSHSTAEVVRALLIGLGQGTDVTGGLAWPIYVGNEPDSPDNCITIYNTQGNDLGRVQFTGGKVEHHGIQVRIRGFGERVGFLKSRQITLALDTQSRLILVSVLTSNYLVLSVNRTSDVLPIGKQVPSNRLDLFTINALVSLRQL